MSTFHTPIDPGTEDHTGAARPTDAGIESASADRGATPASPIERIQSDLLKAEVIELIKTCYDPEIPVDIYALGLIYEVDADAATGHVDIKLTLTSPACPVAGSLPPEVERKVATLEAVTEAKVELVWDPPWTPDKMSEAARLQLNL